MPKLDNNKNVTVKNEIRADQQEWVTIKTLNQVDKHAMTVMSAMGERLNEDVSVESPIVNKRHQNRQQVGAVKDHQKQEEFNPEDPEANLLANVANEAISAQVLNTSMGPSFVVHDPNVYATQAEKFIEGNAKKERYLLASKEENALLEMRVQAIAEGRDVYVTSKLKEKGINITQLAYQNPDAYELVVTGFKRIQSVVDECAKYLAAHVSDSNPVYGRIFGNSIDKIKGLKEAYTLGV